MEFHIIDFMGRNLICPVWVKYMAMDKDGEVYAFESMPVVGPWFWNSDGSNTTRLVQVAKIKDPTNWESSLIKTNDHVVVHGSSPYNITTTDYSVRLT